jgi:hypothetical protein
VREESRRCSLKRSEMARSLRTFETWLSQGPPRVSLSAEYDRIFELELKLGRRPEFAAIARYTQCLARCAGPVTEGGA